MLKAKDLRVLQLGKFYPIKGGVEKVMYELMLGLSEREIRCDMLCAAHDPDDAGTRVINSFATLYCMPAIKKVAATMLSPAMVTKLREIRDNYDIIHIHHPDPMAAVALYFSGYKGKVLLQWHSDILKQKTLLRFYSRVQQWLINRAYAVAGTSPVYVENSEWLRGVSRKLTHIPIGVHAPERIDKNIQAVRARAGNRKIIFALGRLVEYKGYRYLLEAMSHILSGCVLILAGSGPLEEELKNYATQLNLQQKVIFTGMLSDEEVAAHFWACDIFCLSSVMKTEAFGIVQIEAMSCGKPVVSTDIPGSGVQWVNKDGASGLVCPMANGPALAGVLEKLLVDDQCREMLGRGALARYNAEFTPQAMIDKCLEVYSVN